MKFRRPETPQYLGRRHQLRMLGLVFALGLTFLAIQVAGRPAFWAPLFPDESDATQDGRQSVEPVRTVGGNAEPVDPAAEPDTEPADAGEDRTFTARPPRDWFDAVDDDSRGVNTGEARAYYGLLSKAAAASLDEIEAAGEEEPSRSMLMHEPDHYRGRLVTVEGYLQRLTPMTVGESIQRTHGLGERLWDGWVSTPDDPQRPLHVTFTSLPDGIPTGMSISERTKVRVTGWFLKRQAFPVPNDDEVTRTPLILAKEPRIVPPPVIVTGDARELTPYVIGFASVVAIALVVVLVRFRSSDERFGDDHVRQFTEAPEGAIASLSGIETTDPAEVLRRLAAEDAAEDRAAEDGEAEDAELAADRVDG